MFLDLLKSLISVFCSPSKSSPETPAGGPSQHLTKPHLAPRHHSIPSGDLNQVNQSNAHYVNLREHATEEGRLMARAFEESHLLYSRGDKAGAKTLSNEGKEHQRTMESLNKEASDWIFLGGDGIGSTTENNKDSKFGEIDLHGLYVKEALERTDRAIQDAKERGDSELRLIVGQGLHSNGGSAKIKPAVEELMQKHHLLAELDAHNSGVLVVQIDSEGDGWVGENEISRHLN